VLNIKKRRTPKSAGSAVVILGIIGVIFVVKSNVKIKPENVVLKSKSVVMVAMVIVMKKTILHV
jgi:hypothetical protein